MTVNSSLLLLEVKSEEHLSSSQLFCSQMIQNFASEACNPLTLCGLAFGGAIARTVELSCFRSLTALSKASGFGFSRTISYFSSFVGVTTEAGFFAGMPMLEKGGSFSELGIGTAHGTLVIGLSRIVGRYTHSSFLIHCLAQDSVVVGVDIAFETFDLREIQNISGAERFLHARAVAFQMHIGGQISQHLPGIAHNQARFALEKQMNLPSASKRSLRSWFPRFSSGKELVTSTGEVIPEDFLTTEIQNAEKTKRSHLAFMASSEEGRSNASQNHPLSDQFKDLMELSKGGDNNAIETLRQFVVESEDDAVVELASTALGGAATDPDAYAVLEELANSDQIYSSLCQKALNSSRYSGGLFGIDLRDYQAADIAELIDAIKKGKDRHLKRNPWQTGKSLTIGPTWQAVKKYFPKTCLVITPFIANRRQIVGDTSKNPHLKIGEIDNVKKDFGREFDLVIASSHTLGIEANLERLNPDLYDFVIFDEAGTIQTKTALRILIKLGFLDSEGRRRENRGKFLYGLTADQHSLEAVFGEESESSPRDLGWFIKSGYLHNPVGVRVSYQKDFPLTEIRDGKDRILTPPSVDDYCEEIFRVYHERLSGKKTLIKVASVAHAVRMADYFNQRMGKKEYASAVYSHDAENNHSMSKREFEEAIDRYNSGQTTVIVYVNRLAYSLRARQTEGVIVACEISSLRLYGQVVGRPLGVEEMNGVREPQRNILIIDMKGRGKKLYNPATLPRLGGFIDYEIDNEPVDLLQILNAPSRAKPKTPKVIVQAVKGTGAKGIMEFEYVEEGDKALMPEFFPPLLQEVLERDYSNNWIRMARALGTDLDELDRYLHGELPRSLKEVREIAARLQIPERRLLVAWENDFLKIVEALHPMDQSHGRYARQVIEMVRLACLYLGTGTILSVHAVCPTIDYPNLINIFRGEKFPPESHKVFFELFILIRRADLIPAKRIRHLMDRAYREIYQKGSLLIRRIDQYTFEKEISLYGLTPSEPEVNYPDLFIDYETADRLEERVINPITFHQRTMEPLSPREREVLSLRFRLNDPDAPIDDEMSYEEIAVKMRLTGAGARELLKRTLSKMGYYYRSTDASLEHTMDYSWLLTRIPQKELQAVPSSSEVMKKINRFVQSTDSKSREIFNLYMIPMIRSVRLLEALSLRYKIQMLDSITRWIFKNQSEEFHQQIDKILREYIRFYFPQIANV